MSAPAVTSILTICVLFAEAGCTRSLAWRFVVFCFRPMMTRLVFESVVEPQPPCLPVLVRRSIEVATWRPVESGLCTYDWEAARLFIICDWEAQFMRSDFAVMLRRYPYAIGISTPISLSVFPPSPPVTIVWFDLTVSNYCELGTYKSKRRAAYFKCLQIYIPRYLVTCVSTSARYK